MLERPHRAGFLGTTFARLIAEQFHRLKFGDRHFYLNPLAGFTSGKTQQPWQHRVPSMNWCELLWCFSSANWTNSTLYFGECSVRRNGQCDAHAGVGSASTLGRGRTRVWRPPFLPSFLNECLISVYLLLFSGIRSYVVFTDVKPTASFRVENTPRSTSVSSVLNRKFEGHDVTAPTIDFWNCTGLWECLNVRFIFRRILCNQY